MQNIYKELTKVFDGGEGSGNFGHEGRPGKVGGSGSGGTSMQYLDSEVLANPEEHSLGGFVKDTPKGKKITSKRQKIHSQIEKKFLDGVKPSKNPTIYFNGGGSAAGKGSIAKFIPNYPTPENKMGVVVDPDEIKKALPEWDNNDPNSASFLHEESSMLSKHLFNKAMNSKKYDVLMDGTLSGNPDKVIAKIEKAKKSGMPVKANYVTNDIKTALKRNYLRYLDTGRLPSLNTLYQTHTDVSKNFPKVFSHFDSGQLINTDGDTPRVIATFEAGKLKVKDKQAYKEFLAKSKVTKEELQNFFDESIGVWEKEWQKKNPGKKLKKRPEN